MSRFEAAFARFDAANAEDPSEVVDGGRLRPAELLYAERMSAMLGRLYPEASEALRLAARAQHLRRWTVPRTDYPMDRTGYLRWRTDLKRKHAEWAGAMLADVGYEPNEIARVGALIRKENLKVDAEAQALEDVAAMVFLEHYLDAFAEKHDDDKLAGILSKTLVKMSDKGREAAGALPLSDRVRRLLQSSPRPARRSGEKSA